MFEIWSVDLFPKYSQVTMAFARSETALTMVSRANSTSELSAGLAHVLFGAHDKLPEDPEELEEPPQPLKHKTTCLC